MFKNNVTTDFLHIIIKLSKWFKRTYIVNYQINIGKWIVVITALTVKNIQNIIIKFL